jgi:peptidoglycan-associated lipoprotein
MMNKYRLFLATTLALLIAGCASNSIPDPDPDMADADAGTDVFQGGDVAQEEQTASDAASQLATVIYFDYDQDQLRPEYVDLIARHAGLLSGVSNFEVRLEGHADERGSREYNIGLGERRSQAVRNVLLAHGVSGAQLSTVSYGEERPAAVGSDEQSYAMNRRVEISYVN